MEALDAHGRALTTTPLAAAWYRLAQELAHPAAGARCALRHAVDADGDFALAAADLRALTGDPSPAPSAAPRSRWERHHIEIVAAACSGQTSRAAGLLREHLDEVGCDPLALRIVADVVGDADELADLRDAACRCHPNERFSA